MVYTCSKFYMASFSFLEMSQQLHSVTKKARGIGNKKNVPKNLFFILDNREGMLLNVRETVLS